MVAPSLQPGSVVDGFRLDECLHRGSMAAIWRVSREGAGLPLVMKMPNLAEGEDPAAIVSFEMEQLIMPRLSGIHVPQFVAAGDFGAQPYIVMERIPGKTLLPLVGNLPLPYAEAVAVALKIAQALDDVHRQHVIHD